MREFVKEWLEAHEIEISHRTMRISVAPEGIIPVYGKVAYNARQLKRNKENETLKQQAIRDLQGWY